MTEHYLLDVDNAPVSFDIATPRDPVAVAVLAVRDRHNPIAARLAASLQRARFATICAGVLTQGELNQADATPLAVDVCGTRLARVIDSVRTDRRLVQLPLVLVDVDARGAGFVAAAREPTICAVASWAAPELELVAGGAGAGVDIAALFAPAVIIVDEADADALHRAQRCLARSAVSHCGGRNERSRIVVVSRRNAADVEAVIHATVEWLRQHVVDRLDASIVPPA